MAQKLEHLFIKDNNDTNILTVKFSLHFTQKYYSVQGVICHSAEDLTGIWLDLVGKGLSTMEASRILP